ncbi:hypothetical protein BpHYR1_030808, partial [Brachionus plicatilis]
KNPLSSRPFWRKINKFRSKKLTRQIPSLFKDGKEYNSDTNKGKISGDLLATTFSPHLDFVESDDNSEATQIIRDLLNNNSLSQIFCRSMKLLRRPHQFFAIPSIWSSSKILENSKYNDYPQENISHSRPLQLSSNLYDMTSYLVN